MNIRHHILVLGIGLATGPTADAAEPAVSEREQNGWPFVVRQVDADGRVASWTGAGPFLFKTPQGSGQASGFRPIWAQWHDLDGNFRAGSFLYPLFRYGTSDTTYQWSVFELIRRTGPRAGAAQPHSVIGQETKFEVWPVWFSRQAGDPGASYRGFFPVAGTVRKKLGMERFTWIAFPLYVEIEKRGAVTTQTPWPIVRVTRGAARGWGIWPLFNHVDRPGVSREAHYLWPLGHHVVRFPSPEDPPGTAPQRSVGALPFFARSTGPGYDSTSYAWPFFGYTDRTLPTRYRETRYCWPLLVQGRGDDRYVNRWGPFYTHSITRGYDKRWYAWPIVRRAQWAEEGLLRTKTQVLYFLYSAQRQASLARPEAPAATLTHLWPLLSTWNNGAGRRQWQLFSPLEVFFPGNENMRQSWAAFFAIARHEQRAPGDTRTSLLWDAITWETRAGEGRREFHFGPLFSMTTHGGGKRMAIGHGLFSLRRAPGGSWKIFWLDFPARPDISHPGRK